MYILIYIYNKISVLSCWFCQLYISRLLCKQLQLKRLTRRELTSVRQKGRERQVTLKSNRLNAYPCKRTWNTWMIMCRKDLEGKMQHSRNPSETASIQNWIPLPNEVNWLLLFPSPHTVQTLYSSVKQINQLWNYHIFTIVPSCIIEQLQSVTKIKVLHSKSRVPSSTQTSGKSSRQSIRTPKQRM